MNTFAKDFKAAFGSVWALMGILISAVAVFNFLSRVLKIGLSELFAQLLGAFRSVFHPILEFLTGWAIPWLPFLALPEWKDGVFLYLVIGGAVTRILMRITANLRPVERKLWLGSLGFVVQNTWLWPLGFFIALFLWPLMLGMFFKEPIVAKLDNEGTYMTGETYMRASAIQAGTYDYDLRIVFGLHLAAVLAVVATLTLLNAAGVG